MSTMGEYHEYRGGILSTVKGVQYRGGHHDKCGDTLSTVGIILSTVRVFSTVGDIMMHVVDIMSTVGVVLYRGGYHPLKFEYHRGYHDTCGGYHEYRGVLK